MDNYFQILLSVSFFSVMTGLLTYFLDFCIGEPHDGVGTKDRIFSAYGFWVLRKFYAHKKAQDQRAANGQTRRLNWYKMLGACPPCTNTWLCFIVYPGVCLFLPMSIIEIAVYFIPFVVLSNFIVRKLI